jgi:hypothetical protein
MAANDAARHVYQVRATIEWVIELIQAPYFPPLRLQRGEPVNEIEVPITSIRYPAKGAKYL